MVSLRICTTRDGSEDRFLVDGELGLASTPQLGAALRAGLDQRGRHLVVDVFHVRFLDCTAVGMLVKVRGEAQQRDCRLRVAGARGVVLEVLEITGAAKSLDVYAELGEEASPDRERRSGTPPRRPDERISDELITSMLDTLTELPPGSPEHEQIRTHVVEACAPYATALARRFTHRGEPFDDLNLVAMVGLLKDVDG